MAMLMLNDVFERTWGERAGARPADEYWPATIAAVKADHGDFVFMAEAYWDLEYALQQQGFDYCYDKRLYDRLIHDGAEAVHGHLTGDSAYQERLVRFIENHDEPRAAAAFPAGKARAAAVATLGTDRRAARPRRPARRPARPAAGLSRTQARRAAGPGPAGVLRATARGSRRRRLSHGHLAARRGERLGRERQPGATCSPGAGTATARGSSSS